MYKIVLWLTLLLFTNISQAQVPEEAWQHRTSLIKSAWRIFGPKAPIPLLASQIHQESLWQINAKSWAGAEGFAQFMPATAKDMARLHPEDCAPANPYSAKWAFNCRDRYLKGLNRAVRNDLTNECSEWAFGLRSYNGGLTWIRRDKKLTLESGFNPNNWVEVESFNAGRRASAFKENTEYPIKIFGHEKKYTSWGIQLQCS